MPKISYKNSDSTVIRKHHNMYLEQVHNEFHDTGMHSR